MTEFLRGAAPSQDGRDRRWDDHRQARRQHVLETAIRLIDEQGTGVSVPAIAAAAEVPRSVVYKLFRDRKDLDEQISAKIVEQLDSRVWASLETTGTIREIIESTLQEYVGWVAAHPHLQRFLAVGSAGQPGHGAQASRSGKAAFATRAAELIELAWSQLQPGTPLPPRLAESLASGAMGLVDSVVNRWFAPGHDQSPEPHLVRFLADAACGVVEAAARQAGAVVDLDAVISL